VLEDAVDLVNAALGDLEVAEVEQGDVQDGAVLRDVDVLAGEHRIAHFIVQRGPILFLTTTRHSPTSLITVGALARMLPAGNIPHLSAS
jgi:hypothetical protein